MNFLNKLKDYIWGTKDAEDQDDDYQDQCSSRTYQSAGSSYARGIPRSGYGSRTVPDTLVVPQEPILREVEATEAGGVQGLTWFATSQMHDQHGDYANAFLDESDAAAGRLGPGGGGSPPGEGQARAAPNGTAGVGDAGGQQDSRTDPHKDQRRKDRQVSGSGAAAGPQPNLRVQRVERGAVVLGPP